MYFVNLCGRKIKHKVTQRVFTKNTKKKNHTESQFPSFGGVRGGKTKSSI